MSYSKLTIITMGNDDDDSTAILPDETKRLWKDKIRAAIAKLEVPKKQTLFRKGFYWAFNVWGFAAQTLSPASPPVSYGTTWVGFASYVQRFEDKLAAMQTLEEEDDEDAELQ